MELVIKPLLNHKFIIINDLVYTNRLKKIRKIKKIRKFNKNLNLKKFTLLHKEITKFY